MTTQWPVTGARTSAADKSRFLETCRVGNDKERQVALRGLCTCHVQADDGEVWDTLIAMLDDPVVRVRAEALHAVTDSTPGTRVASVVDALEQHRNEPDDRLRRRIRKTLAHYRRTGKLTDAPQ